MTRIIKCTKAINILIDNIGEIQATKSKVNQLLLNLMDDDRLPTDVKERCKQLWMEIF